MNNESKYSDAEIQSMLDIYANYLKTNIGLRHRCPECNKFINTTTIHKLKFSGYLSGDSDNLQVDYEVYCDYGHKSVGTYIITEDIILLLKALSLDKNIA